MKLFEKEDFPVPAPQAIEGTPNVAPGEMGKRDMIIIEAIYQSIKEGRKKYTLIWERWGMT